MVFTSNSLFFQHKIDQHCELHNWVFFSSSFPNDVCKAGTKNGTCYTQAECTERNGEESGSCASGFGVCCVCKYLIKNF